ncbi:MAG TPA: maleylpyruvate isomerase family mycothiol-dependent enzyme [Jatrophihabitans sp.]|nr:maleylpyruvate isomerase family mycothiol-dependent enzyme [Jatrophihabitans sp.]
MDRDELNRRIGWMRAGTELLVTTVRGLPDGDLAAPSLLPGWSRAHLLGHLARNSDALLNLLSWARTGVENPMYPSAGARAEGIERSAGQPVAELRADFEDGVRRLDEAVRELPDDAWQGMVRTARGRPVPGAEVPWMRVREVWVHVVDLDAGVSFADVPTDVGAALLTDAFAFAANHPDAPPVRVLPTDAELELRLGAGEPATEVRAPVGELLPWALGRDALLPPGLAWPHLPPWL